jgi:glycosyltransferase involved in cell wall biosynthesis
MTRLVIVATHPIQYYSPWFRHIAANSGLDLHVLYLWNFGVTSRRDPGFNQAVQWDIPLLDGYENQFVPNVASDPGTHRFNGLDNPSLGARIRDLQPDVLLFMAYRYRSILRVLFSPRHGVPRLFRGDSHRLGEARTGSVERLRRRAIHTIFERLDGFLTVGTANREYFRLHGVADDRMFHCPHCVDNDRFIGAGEAAARDACAWRAQLGIPATDKVVLFAGKFAPIKRPLDLVDAFLAAGLPGTTLLLVGAGELEPAMRARASGHPSVVFAPFQNQSLMPRALAACDLLVLPSESETWGLILNEAMCLRKPVIASDRVGATLDLVRHGENGLVFPKGDVAALTSCLRDALSDPERLGRWGEAGFGRVQRFHYADATEGLRRAVDTVLSRKVVPR